MQPRKWTTEDCWDALRREPLSIGDLPESLLTPEMCRYAAERDGLALAFMPLPCRTPEVCLAAVRDRGAAVLEHVPWRLQTPNLLAAVMEREQARDGAGQPDASPVP